jgi:type IV fimbrial biogenesis protein FimT
MRHTSRGFTLIELMVVVTIAGVMVGIGMPSFKNFVAGQRVKTAAGDFSTAAIYARSEAIKRNAEVGLVAAAGGWKNGWSVKAGAVTLSQQAAFPALTMTSAVTEVVYLGSGRLKEQVLVSSLQVAADGASSARCISFDLSGLPKSRLGNC